MVAVRTTVGRHFVLANYRYVFYEVLASQYLLLIYLLS